MNSTQNPSSEQHLVMYFQVHQPRRLKVFPFFNIGLNTEYFDDKQNEDILSRIAKECYIPTNKLLLEVIRKYPQIKVAFSISGGTLDQMELYAPEALETFKELSQTQCVEFLAETNYHSLSSIMGGDEFDTQIIQHSEKIYKHFGRHPKFFRNTELIYSDEIGKRVHQMGFDGIMTDGISKILGDRSPHHLYQANDFDGIKLLFRNYRLSDDIAFRFHSLKLEDYVSWLNAVPNSQDVVTLAMDYETFGEHQKTEAGIHSFLEQLLVHLAHQKKFRLSTPSDVVAALSPKDVLHCPEAISWADQERDLSAWLGNAMQRDAFETLQKLEHTVKRLDQPELLDTWRHLMTSDHFYYMSTKKYDDGKVHAYFSPYSSPYEAFINYMNVLSDFSLQIEKADRVQKEIAAKNNRLEYERQHHSVPHWAERIVESLDHGHHMS